ncbi:DMT family transporter, partial [Spirulina sp. 06S082]|uniref:DMT family transporter n=1 Tax=Spirulina sp. 06S082 TaxID=3110248 RepID=UPI002B1EA5A2
IFTTIVGWILLRQQFDRRFLLGMAIAVFGSIALVANDFSLTADKLAGDSLALASALFWGGYLLVTEKLRDRSSIMAIATWESILSTIFFLPVMAISGDELFPHSLQGWLTAIVLGICVIFTVGLTTYSLKWLSSGLVATLSLLHPAITTILAWSIFSETLDFLNLLAFLVILLGSYWVTSSKTGVKNTFYEIE